MNLPLLEYACNLVLFSLVDSEAESESAVDPDPLATELTLLRVRCGYASICGTWDEIVDCPSPVRTGSIIYKFLQLR